MAEDENRGSTPAKEASGDTTNETKPVRSPIKLALLLLSLCLAVLCQALDNTIITTAIPKITDEFNSLQDVGWYGYVNRRLSTEGSVSLILVQIWLPPHHLRLPAVLRQALQPLPDQVGIPHCHRDL